MTALIILEHIAPEASPELKASLQYLGGTLFVEPEPCKKCMSVERKGGKFEGFYQCMKTMEDK